MKCCKLRKTDTSQCYFEWSYDSWTKKYGYICDDSYLRAFGKALALLLMTFICLFLLYFADFVGRQKIVKCCSIMIIICVFLQYVTPNLLIKMIWAGFASGAESTFNGLFPILINENTCKTPKKINKTYSKRHP